MQALKIPRARAPRSEDVSTLGDALVVLGAARNQTVAYRCAWFEVHDWKTKGRTLFPVIEAIAEGTPAPGGPGPVLKTHLSEFAQPARLLHEKIEMYRHLPALRKQIEALQSEMPFAEVVLETVDEAPVFDTTSAYPLGTLEWASRLMRAFSSFSRQILTTCNLDVDSRAQDERIDASGVAIDASYFLKELLAHCTELMPLRSALELCISDSSGGTLTLRTAGILAKVFRVITEILEVPGRIPDPRPEYESRRERNQRMDGLIVRLREVAIAEPYIVSVADIRNLVHLCSVGEILGVSYEEAMSQFLKWVGHAGKEAERAFAGVKACGPCADNLILVGHNADELVRATIFLIRQTTQRLAAIDGNQFAHLGLLRAGIALNHSAQGDPFSAVTPGLIAHSIGDRSGRALGAVVVTESVFNLLSTDLKQDFRLSEEKATEQGVLWLREWSHERDGH